MHQHTATAAAPHAAAALSHGALGESRRPLPTAAEGSAASPPPPGAPSPVPPAPQPRRPSLCSRTPPLAPRLRCRAAPRAAAPPRPARARRPRAPRRPAQRALPARPPHLSRADPRDVKSWQDQLLARSTLRRAVHRPNQSNHSNHAPVGRRESAASGTSPAPLAAAPPPSPCLARAARTLFASSASSVPVSGRMSSARSGPCRPPGPRDVSISQTKTNIAGARAAIWAARMQKAPQPRAGGAGTKG
jgi:hypothetical protein